MPRTAEPPAADLLLDSGERSLSRDDLVERLGEASGIELFDRMDQSLRRGDRILGSTVREARTSFSEARTPGHARLVMPGRAGSGEAAAEELVVLAFSDLQAVVKAGHADFDWAAEFAPRPDLPIPTVSLVVRSGAAGRRVLKP